jgi:hypothetical protein
MMKYGHLNVVRVDMKIGPSILMTRFGTRRDHALRTTPSPLTKRMRPGSVWRIRWRSAELRGQPEQVVLIDARPVRSVWVC